MPRFLEATKDVLFFKLIIVHLPSDFKYKMSASSIILIPELAVFTAI
jgi:hypothetical protein|tara:strand:- start:173 stop:313 length:141 start_codon:yes stop_codon:yes gene_type:complete